MSQQQVVDRAKVVQRRRLSPLLWVAIAAAVLGWFGFSFAGMPWLTVGPASLALLVGAFIWLVALISRLITSRPRPPGLVVAGVILGPDRHPVRCTALSINDQQKDIYRRVMAAVSEGHPRRWMTC